MGSLVRWENPAQSYDNRGGRAFDQARDQGKRGKMILNWTDPGKRILEEIADPAMSEEDIIIDYVALIILTDGKPDPRIDVAKINTAIVNRWSKTARDRIKKEAWKRVISFDSEDGK